MPRSLTEGSVTAGQKMAISKPKRDPKQSEPKSGKVPEGDVRLTANIRGDLHMKLKMKAVMERTTIGELIEELIEKNL